MMIDPKSFISEYKDSAYEELIALRDELVEDIRLFEAKEKAGDHSGPAWQFRPSPEVIYQMNLQYLAELCNFMQEKYNKEYVFGDKKL